MVVSSNQSTMRSFFLVFLLWLVTREIVRNWVQACCECVCEYVCVCVSICNSYVSLVRHKSIPNTNLSKCILKT